MTDETLYLELAKEFERRAAARATDDIDRHTNSAFVNYLEALITYAHFATPFLAYIGLHSAEHLINRVTDGAIDKAIDAARRFAKRFVERLHKEVQQPTLNFDPKEFETVASQADAFSVVLFRQAPALDDVELERGIERGRAAARDFLKSQLHFADQEAERIAETMAIDVRKAIKGTKRG